MIYGEKLPTPCLCGFDGRARRSFPQCPQVGLLNHVHFPPFSDLPDENDVDERYYDFSTGCGIPRKHWCLVGEVVEAVWFMRMRAQIRTRFGEEINVNFHLEDADEPMFFSWKDLVPGSTMCILYPVIRNFMDMSRGIRQESPSTVMVFPVTQKILCAEVSKISTSLDADAKHVCAICCKADVKVSACSKCKAIHYCGRECQQSHWKQGHKHLCGGGHITVLKKLARFNMDKFHDFQDWTFDLEPEPQKTKDERLRVSMQEHFHRMCPGNTLFPLRRLLDAIGGRVLLKEKAEMVLGRVSEDIRKMILPSGTEMLVRELFIFQKLQEFCDEQANDMSQAVHVVDQKEDVKGDGGGLGGFGTEFATASFMLAVPLWLQELGLCRELAFIVEDHCFFHYIDGSAFDDKDWSVVKDSDSVDSAFFNHRQHGTVCVLADSMVMVGNCLRVAEMNPSRTCVRILRATGNTSYSKMVKELANQKVPKNLFTLWIREDVRILGSFTEPYDKNDDLVKQLLAAQHVDPLMRMLHGMGSPLAFDGSSDGSSGGVRFATSKGRRKTHKKSKQDGQKAAVCCVCGGREPEVQFSKNQRSKAYENRKCANCVKMS